MNRTRDVLHIVFTLVVLSAAHVAAQAVRPAPASVPLIQQRPPSYPGQTYTPAGTGARPEDLVAPPGRVEMPRSKGPILPAEPDGAPGLWSAGPRPESDAPVTIAGVVLPSPSGQSTAETRRCARTMNIAIGLARTIDAVQALPEDVRRCLAANLFQYCATRRLRPLSSDPQPEDKAREAAFATAVRFAETACVDRKLARAADTLYDRIVREWLKHTRTQEAL